MPKCTKDESACLHKNHKWRNKKEQKKETFHAYAEMSPMELFYAFKEFARIRNSRQQKSAMCLNGRAARSQHRRERLSRLSCRKRCYS